MDDFVMLLIGGFFFIATLGLLKLAQVLMVEEKAK